MTGKKNRGTGAVRLQTLKKGHRQKGSVHTRVQIAIRRLREHMQITVAWSTSAKFNSGVASIVRALLRITTFAKSSIPSSAVHGKVEDLEGRIKVIGKELNASNANHAILDYQASVGALLFT